jgi:hypothetical protein
MFMIMLICNAIQDAGIALVHFADEAKKIP